MICKKAILLIFLSLSAANCFGQYKTLNLQYLTSENGLSSNQVTCVIRDPLGFMWIGTKDGLNRYDGREFYVFKNDASDSGSVCGNNIKCLELDADSLLWIGTTGNGFCSYDFRTGKFKNYNKQNTLLRSNSINDIAFDKQKNILWIAQNHSGLQIFDLQKKAFSTNPKVVSTNTYYDVEMVDTVPYFAGIVESLKQLNHVGRSKRTSTKAAGTINKIFAGTDSKIWCGAWDNALHEFNKNSKLLASYYFDGSTELKLSGDEIISIAEDANNTLWCGTKTSGLLFFDLNTKTFSHQIKLSRLIKSRINQIYKDNFNRMWIATETGLFVYDPLLNQFQKTVLPIPTGIISCKTYDRLITNGGKEFVITKCGLFYKNSSNSPYTFKDIVYRGEKQELTSMFSDSRGRIFIGTNRTVLEFDTISLTTKPMPANPVLVNNALFLIGASRISSIVEITQNGKNYLAANYYGNFIGVFDITRKNIFYLLNDTTVKDRFLDNLCRKMLIDSKNNFWFCGANNGITKVLIPDSVSLDSYPFANTIASDVYITNKSWAKSISGNIKVNNAFDMIENADGSFWVTTQGNGLVKFFPQNDSLPFVSHANNIKSLHGIAKSGEESVWMISSMGLLNYNTKTNRYKLFDAKSGVNEILSGYFFKNSMNSSLQGEKIGTLSAGFDGGFISFNPDKILKDTEKPNVTISRLWVMDIPSDSLLLSDLKLSYKTNFIKFYISSNCFSNNEQVTYQYRLNGIDDNWRSNDKSPLVTYTNLPHGEFLFEFKAVNSDGVESDIKSYAVTITPPFYKTFYFYALIGVVVFSAAYLFYRFRISQLLKLQEVRNKIARDLHDDIGSTIGSINIYSQVANVKLNGNNAADVKSILEKIEESSREIIDKTADAVWAVSPANDTIKNLVMRMEAYAASLLGTANISFKIDCDEDLYSVVLEMNQRKNLFLIYKEAIHNILKYANATHVNITITKAAGKINLVIADNGKGIEQNKNAYNGNGINNMKARAEELNGSFQIFSKNGEGTKIEVNI